MLILDDWQKEYIAYKGDKILVAGRQTGKSEAQAYDNGDFCANNPATTTLILSKTERQAEELLIKTMNYLAEVCPKRIGTGDYKTLKQIMWIIHGKKERPSRVMSLPTGFAGEGIKGMTIHKLSIDEAQLPEDDVFYNVSPMMLTTGGKMALTGTPRGRKGFFWECYQNKQKQFKIFKVNSEEVMKNRPISESWPQWKRDAALEFLRREKERMPAKWYAQEYLAEFVEDLMQFFPDAIIAKSTILQRHPNPLSIEKIKFYLGVDVGRTIDPSTFEIVAQVGEQLMHLDSLVRKEISIPETAELIKELHRKYKFKKIGVDSGGLGIGVIDILNREAIGDRVIDLNNAKRLASRRDDKKGRLLKQGMYLNMYTHMSSGRLQILNDADVIDSLKSIQIDYGEKNKEPIIFSINNHITEGLIRAVWIATEDKGLNLFATHS